MMDWQKLMEKLRLSTSAAFGLIHEMTCSFWNGWVRCCSSLFIEYYLKILYDLVLLLE